MEAPRVLRVYHSAVVTGWRERERELLALGCDVRVVGARRWNEGGSTVVFDAAGDDFAVSAATLGQHPYRFVFDPRPIIREMRSRPLDLIDIHEEPASVAALEVRVLARIFQPGVPIVYYGAQNLEKRFPIPFRWFERSALRSAAGAHTCNSDAGRIFVGKGLSGITRTIGLGVDVALFAPSADPVEPTGGLRVGYVGRLEPHKGVDVLLRAVAELPDVGLTICGEGSDGANLRPLVTELGIAERVTFLGHTPYDELPAVYCSLDVVAIPSLRTPRWVEQFGRVAVEAMASGVPTIASDEGSLRDVIGSAGLFATAGDVDSWRVQLERLRDDRALRVRLRCAGLERSRDFSWASIADDQLDFYEEAIKGQTRSDTRRVARVVPDDATSAQCLVVCSLEAWDDVWRRNQFLVRELTDADPSLRVLFVEPPADPLHELLARRRLPSLRNVGRVRPVAGRPQVLRFQPIKPAPRSLGGWVDQLISRQVLRAAWHANLAEPTLWVNDPSMAPLLGRCGWPVLYDITDDWLLASMGDGARDRLQRNENHLMTSAGTVVVCSPGLVASKGAGRPVRLIPNATDLAHFRTPQARPSDLPPGRVAVYAGTLHDDRIDVDLVVGLAAAMPDVAFAYIGPDALSSASREQLGEMSNVHLLGARPYAVVPGYLQHADVVIVPHVVSPFTESLDPIKAYECAAVGRPTLATPVAGFRGMEPPIEVADRAGFVERLATMLDEAGPDMRPGDVAGWRSRAEAFALALDDARAQHDRPRALTPARRVVYLDHTAVLSGGELALLRVLPALTELGVEPHVILGENGPLVGELLAAGISTEVLPMSSEARQLRRDRVRPGRLPLRAFWDTARYTLTLARRLRTLQPALVHTNSLKAALYGGVAGRAARVPVLWHVRDRIAPDYLPSAAVRGVRALARVLPSAIIANSRSTLETVGVRTGPRSVAPSPVVMDAVHRNECARDRGARPFTVAIVGRLSPWKGQDVFLDAFAKAFPAGDERALLVGSAMFGEEEYEAALRTQCDRLALERRVEFLGFQRDVFSVLAGVDLLVHASTVPEPFGQVIIEGMAAGVPVVASAGGGPTEIITHGVDGVLIPPGDVDALAGWLRTLAGSPRLRGDLAQAGRVRALDFTPEQVASTIVNIYGRVAR